MLQWQEYRQLAAWMVIAYLLIASGVVGLLSLAVKKKPLELGDYFTAASTVISFLGSLGLRLSPLGAVYNSNLPPLQGEARSGGGMGRGWTMPLTR